MWASAVSSGREWRKRKSLAQPAERVDRAGHFKLRKRCRHGAGHLGLGAAAQCRRYHGDIAKGDRRLHANDAPSGHRKLQMRFRCLANAPGGAEFHLTGPAPGGLAPCSRILTADHVSAVNAEKLASSNFVVRRVSRSADLIGYRHCGIASLFQRLPDGDAELADAFDLAIDLVAGDRRGDAGRSSPS